MCGLALAVIVSLGVVNVDEFSTIERIKQMHSDLLVSNRVFACSLAGNQYYVANGRAEIFFNGKDGERDSELEEEARLLAKHNLARELLVGRNGTIDISRLKILFRHRMLTSYVVIIAVRKDDISIGQAMPSSNSIPHAIP